MSHRIVHIGDPMPLPRPKVRIIYQGSKAIPNLYTPPHAVRHKDEIAAEWGKAGHPTFPTGVHLVVEASFCFARPAGHYGRAGIKPAFLQARPGYRGKNADGQRTGADVDNCVKLILDALNGTAWPDDGQVAEVRASKLFCDQAGVDRPQTIIEIHELVALPNLGLVAA